MKRINYNFCTTVNLGTEENPIIHKDFTPVSMIYSEENLKIAKKEAYNGEYIIEDDGVEEVYTPTQMDRLEAQTYYTAMMTDTLLEV